MTANHAAALPAPVWTTCPLSVERLSHQPGRVTTFVWNAHQTTLAINVKGVRTAFSEILPFLASHVARVAVVPMRTRQFPATVTTALAAACVAVETQVAGTVSNAWMAILETQPLVTADCVTAA